ncbi:hypothetical protein ACJ41O_006728 [Fusarium nematophilum]
MEAILSFFSPRKQPSADPAPALPHAHQHSPAKTYSRKDRVRAKRALDRIARPDGRSPRNHTSDASSITHAYDTTAESSQLSQVENTTVDMDTTGLDVEDAALPVAKKRSSITAKRTHVEPDDPVDSRETGAEIADITGSPELGGEVRSFQAQEDSYELVEDDEPEEDDEMEDEEQYDFVRIMNHRWTKNKMQLHIQWKTGPSTWEPEENFHRDAPDSLFDYWRSKGGRPQNPKNPDMYDIFAIRDHSRNKRRLLVEWVGYEREDMTWMPRKAVEETAKVMVDDYFANLKK